MKKVVIISPHPDDDVIGMGGTIAKLKEEGNFLISIYVSEGSRSPYKESLDLTYLSKIREKEAKKAAEILNIDRTIFLRRKNLRERKEKRKVFFDLKSNLIRLNPEVIYLPHLNENHQTHRIVSKRVIQIAKDFLPKDILILAYEVWTPISNPDILVDITPYLKLKRRAILAHKSQLKDKDFLEGILGLNRYRGVFFEVEIKDKKRYIEAFRKIKINKEEKDYEEENI